MDKKQQLDQLKQKIIFVLKSYGILRAGIFGSYARGEQKNKSDIDILVKIKKNASIFDVIELKINLEKILKKKVDLVEYDLIRKEIRKNILNEEIPLIRWNVITNYLSMK